MKIYLCNAFSPSMLDRTVQKRATFFSEMVGCVSGLRKLLVRCSENARVLVPVDDPVGFLEIMDRVKTVEVISIIGHPDTAVLFSAILNRPVACNRQAIRLSGSPEEEKEFALIGQVVAADGSPYRLAPGTTVLPEDARIEWWIV